MTLQESPRRSCVELRTNICKIDPVAPDTGFTERIALCDMSAVFSPPNGSQMVTLIDHNELDYFARARKGVLDSSGGLGATSKCVHKSPREKNEDPPSPSSQPAEYFIPDTVPLNTKIRMYIVHRK